MNAQSEESPLLLMYHTIAPYDEDPFEVTVSPRRFERQMRWLVRRGLQGTSVRQLLDARAGGLADRLVGLTFDDGYQDFLSYALPILRGCGFTATVFAVAGRLGGINVWDPGGPIKPLMSGDQLREVADAGMEIGSHGFSHVRLATVSPEQLDEELVRSRTILRDITGQPVQGFCYPYGVVSQPVVDRVREAGYDYACAIWRSDFTDRHALARTYVHDRDHWLRLDAKRARHRLTAKGGFRPLSGGTSEPTGSS